MSVVYMDFPGSSDGKASACNAGDLGSIPGSGRSPGEGNAQFSSVKYILIAVTTDTEKSRKAV